MGFYSTNFVFRNVPSETYNLYLSTPDGGETMSPGSSDTQIIEQKVYRKSTPYFYGAELSPILEFPITITTPTELTEWDTALIQKWLFGHKEYSKLQIVQEDTSDAYFNCMLVRPQIMKVGNIIRGFNCTVRCDAPWGWTFPKTLTYNYTVSDVNASIRLNNLSDDNEYNYPEIEFTLNALGGDFSIINTSESNRLFSFTGLQANEIMTVNNELEIISSSNGLLRLSNFNRKFLRLIPGYNILTVLGNISQLKMTMQFAKKIG